jgi:hypothetical protein
MSDDIGSLDSLLFVSVKQGEIVKRYTPQEYADLQRIAKLYLSVCDFGNMDVERRRNLCRRIVSDG